MVEVVGFDEFKVQWLSDIIAGEPSAIELGHRFAQKIFTQWKNISDTSNDLIYTDGPGDGGIDLAYLEHAENLMDLSSDVSEDISDTWYLIQSKYGSAFHGRDTLIAEGQKIIFTLESINANSVSTQTKNLVARINQFRRNAYSYEKKERIVVVFATEKPLSDIEYQALDNVRLLGQEKLGSLFDVEAVSLETIYRNTLDDMAAADQARVHASIEGKLTQSGGNLLIGSLTLPNLYNFLKNYRSQTGDLDQLYEKNVRLFLGGRRAVNKNMRATLVDNPEHFGLYNNGITLVVKDFEDLQNGHWKLLEPYVVNGCQTTRTIWEVFQQKLEGGGHGIDPILDEWKGRTENGVIVAKIVRVGNGDENLLHNITRYTNSQNAVSEKDFVTLEESFHTWKKKIAEKYSLFLEIQRGGWDSQQAYQRQNPSSKQFTLWANAFDLLKVYGAGWLRQPGVAFGRNAAFVPGGTLYREIVEKQHMPFGVEDLFATYKLQQITNKYGFGRGAKKISRRLTRYLFYFVVLDLLRDVLGKAGLPTTRPDLTQCLVSLFLHSDQTAINELLDAAIGVIDEYLTQDEQSDEDTIFQEAVFKEDNDLNRFLKRDKLGQKEQTPILFDLLTSNKRSMGRGQRSTRDLIIEVIS